jgi:hypothetical protein
VYASVSEKIHTKKKETICAYSGYHKKKKKCLIEHFYLFIEGKRKSKA